MFSKRFIKLALPVTVAALMLTACGDDGDDGDSGATGGGASGGSGATYTIGFQAGLSGENAQLGINELNGATLAVDQANASGKFPFKIKLEKSDDEASETKAASAATKLIGNDKVLAVIGPAFSGPTKASAKQYAEAKLAIVTPSATNVKLTDPANGFTSFLRAVPADDQQGKGQAAYLAKKLKSKNVMIVDDKSEYGVGLSEVVKKELEAAGVKAQTESVPKGTPDYSSAATKVKNSGADALVYAGYYQDAAPFAKKLKDANVSIPMISGDGTNDDKFIELAGAAAEGWTLTCPCADAALVPATQQFAKDYQAKFNTAPSTYSAESFDIANMIIDQIKTMDAAKEKITREALLNKLKVVNYAGLTKPFKFDKNGEFASPGVFLYEVKGGKRGYLGDIDKVIAGG